MQIDFSKETKKRKKKGRKGKEKLNEIKQVEQQAILGQDNFASENHVGQGQQFWDFLHIGPSAFAAVKLKRYFFCSFHLLYTDPELEILTCSVSNLAHYKDKKIISGSPSGAAVNFLHKARHVFCVSWGRVIWGFFAAFLLSFLLALTRICLVSGCSKREW